MREKGRTVTENGTTAGRGGEEIRNRASVIKKGESSQSMGDGEQCFGLELFSDGLLDLGVGLEGRENAVSEGSSAR